MAFSTLNHTFRADNRLLSIVIQGVFHLFKDMFWKAKAKVETGYTVTRWY